ncbi:MAG: hypothetical protein WC812_00380 [Candidatus Pacearchaeota archaeon]|jgi:hypothetical protein
MILSQLIIFPVEENLFERVIKILKEDYGLVPAYKNPRHKVWDSFQILVWEDEKKIGRYRVHCCHNMKLESIEKDKNYDYFTFHYWDNLNKEIFLKDPMKEPLQKVLSLSKKRIETKTQFYEISSFEEFEGNIK